LETTNISILIIYTGGTIGMVNNPETGVLQPVKFEHITEDVPELKRFGYHFATVPFDPPIDSSDMDINLWIKLAGIIEENYELYDGFVVLHGTDTMSYTASTLSFMLENLSKPIIFTGSQLPLGMIRTDGKENLITAIEIAAAKSKGKPIISEVCIYFENHLYRANRTTKHHAEYFNAFRSYNYPPLAEVGIHINYNYEAIHPINQEKKLKVHAMLDDNVAILKLFPGINRNVLEGVLNIHNLKGLVLETFGSGNATTKAWFEECLTKATQEGIIILNVTQCKAGSVDMGRYSTSLPLIKANVANGYDLTTESAITKLMFLLGQNLSKEKTIELLQTSISGEITIR
jgi:L-asparaginase